MYIYLNSPEYYGKSFHIFVSINCKLEAHNYLSRPSIIVICIFVLTILFEEKEDILFTFKSLTLITVEHHLEKIHLFNKYYGVPVKSCILCRAFRNVKVSRNWRVAAFFRLVEKTNSN